MIRYQVVVCEGNECVKSNSISIKEEFEKKINAYGINNISVFSNSCFGLCDKGPVVIIYPDCTMYASLKVEDVDEICKEHLINGKIVTRLNYTDITPEDEQKLSNTRK